MADATANATPSRRHTLTNSYSASQNPGVTILRHQLRQSAAHKMVEISYEHMMNKFLQPMAGEPDPAQLEGIFGEVNVARLEVDRYKPLADALNTYATKFGVVQSDAHAKDGQFVVVATDSRPDNTDLVKRKVDLGMYRKDSTSVLEKRTDWSQIELSIEVKKDENLDPFVSDSNLAQGFLGQIMTYTDLVFKRQQRTHYYTLAIFGKKARIARWDRSGYVFTEKFDYTIEPEKLALFVWRLSHATRDVRGHDLTAARIVKKTAEYELLKSYLEAATGGPAELAAADASRASGETAQSAMGAGNTTEPAAGDSAKPAPSDHARELFVNSLKNQKKWPWWKLTIPNDDPKKPPYVYLVGEPTFYAPDVVGRGTRGYVALDYTDPTQPKAFVYLKDCWRVVHPCSEQEGAILTYLNSKRVGHIPTMLCHGDIGKETVMARDIWKEVHGAEKECPLKNHRHYRLVVKEVGKPLKMFENGKQLVWVILHALLAHMQAYTKAHTMHRDISVGNILIMPAPGKNAYGCYGLLTDWELSKHTDVNYTEARHPDRTGTWQFMSINALCKPTKEIDIPDELESLFHVLLYCSMRWIPHNCADVGAFMYKYFDEGVPVDQEHKEYAASLLKRLVFASGELIAPNNARIVFLKAPQPSLPAILPLVLSAATDSDSESDASHSPMTSRSGTPTPQSRSAPATDSAPPQPVIPEGDRHPIDHLLNDLLPLFKALYEHQKVPFLRPKERPQLELETIEEWVASSGLDADDLNFLGTPGVDLPDQSEDLAALEKTAKKLEVHDNVAKILFTALSKNAANYWPAQDKQADQLAPKYVPNQPVKDSAAKSGKRTSLHDGTFEETGRPAARPRSSTVSRT